MANHSSAKIELIFIFAAVIIAAEKNEKTEATAADVDREHTGAERRKRNEKSVDISGRMGRTRAETHL